MARKRRTHPLTLDQKYPPSEPCDCEVCRSYCRRPGWWTVAQAVRVIEAGLGPRMMLELSPDLSIGVLSPAFKGCEHNFAFQEFSDTGCTFFNQERCELHAGGLEPLECCFCHHSRVGEGPKCHADLEKDWNSPTGQGLVAAWAKAAGLWERYRLVNTKA